MTRDTTKRSCKRWFERLSNRLATLAFRSELLVVAVALLTALLIAPELRSQELSPTEARLGSVVEIPFDTPVLRTDDVVTIPVSLTHNFAPDQGPIHLSMGLDYDEVILTFLNFDLPNGSIATSVDESPDSDSALFTIDASRSGERTILAYAHFALNPFAFDGNEYTSATFEDVDIVDALLFPADADPTDPSRGIEPEQVRNGRITVYLRDMIELGSVILTPERHGRFTVPVYVTHLENTFVPFGMGLDYDEIILMLVHATPAPGLAELRDDDVVVEWLEELTPGDDRNGESGVPQANAVIRAWFQGAFPKMRRRHLLDLHFEILSEDASGPVFVTPLTPPDEIDGQAANSDLRSGYVDFVGAYFIRGDVNFSGQADVSDVTRMLEAIYGARGIRASSLLCPEAADVNDSGRFELSDSVYLLNYLFRAGREPASPFPEAGPDPDSESSLGCDGESVFERVPLGGE